MLFLDVDDNDDLASLGIPAAVILIPSLRLRLDFMNLYIDIVFEVRCSESPYMNISACSLLFFACAALHYLGRIWSGLPNTEDVAGGRGH